MLIFGLQRHFRPLKLYTIANQHQASAFIALHSPSVYFLTLWMLFGYMDMPICKANMGSIGSNESLTDMPAVADIKNLATIYKVSCGNIMIRFVMLTPLNIFSSISSSISLCFVQLQAKEEICKFVNLQYLLGFIGSSRLGLWFNKLYLHGICSHLVVFVDIIYL